MAPGIPTLEDIMTWKLHKRQFMYQVQGGIDLQKLLDYSNRLAISAFIGEDCYFFANDEQDFLEMIMMMIIIIHSSVPDPDN